MPRARIPQKGFRKERVVATATRLLTAEDLYSLPSDLHCELVDGMLIESQLPGILHSRVAAKAGIVLARAEAMGLGYVIGKSGYILRRGPDTVRAPDTPLVCAGRVTLADLPRTFSELIPDV